MSFEWNYKEDLPSIIKIYESTGIRIHFDYSWPVPIFCLIQYFHEPRHYDDFRNVKMNCDKSNYYRGPDFALQSEFLAILIQELLRMPIVPYQSVENYAIMIHHNVLKRYFLLPEE